MAESGQNGPSAKGSANNGAGEPVSASTPNGTRWVLAKELSSSARHLAEAAVRLETEVPVSESVENQFSELTQELSKQREAFLRADVEIANLRLQLEGERDRRQRTEEERLQLRKALETMQLGVTIANHNGVIVYVNPADARIHGHTVDELLGKDVGIYAVGFQHKPLTLAKLRTLKSYQRETFNRRKDGSIFKVRLLSDVVRNSEGDPIG